MNGILALFFFDVCAWHAGHHRTGRQGSVDFPEAKGGMRIHKCSTWLSIFPKLPEPCQILLLADTLPGNEGIGEQAASTPSRYQRE
jgi:hypothetical protein